MTDPLAGSYDAIPFDSGAITDSHPDVLAAVARMYGLRPPDVAACRVLELGCSTGGNLLAMATSLPRATFVGVDLSPRQIATAREIARGIGVRNVDVRALSIDQIDDSFGTFDFIICHGVYSWVTEPIQDAILRVCARHLAPDGLAFISYNTLPAWRMRGLVREMLVYHDDTALAPAERIARAREFARFLSKNVGAPNSVYRAVVDREVETIAEMSDSYFFHEFLELENRPVYYADFVRRTADHGLRCVCPAGLSSDDVALPRHLRDQMQRWSGDAVRLEQYGDFLRERAFRQTVLCHAIEGDFRLSSERITSLYLAARAAPVTAAADPLADISEEFRTPVGIAVATAHPVLRAVLHQLFESLPHAVRYDDLCRLVARRLSRPSLDHGTSEELRDALLQCAQGRLVSLHVHQTPCASRAEGRPMASPIARYQADSADVVTNLRHQAVHLGQYDRAVLRLLDGTRDRTALVDALHASSASGTDIRLDPSDGDVDDSLRRIAGSALLVHSDLAPAFIVGGRTDAAVLS